MKISSLAINPSQLVPLLAILGLSGCGQSDINASLQQIREVQVDPYEQVATAGTQPLDEKDVAVMVKAAKALTTDDGGILRDENGNARMNINVIPASQMDRKDDGREILDVSPDEAYAVAKELPELSNQASTQVGQTPQAPVLDGRYIQVGSFSNMSGAQAAWNGLMQKGAVLGLKPQYIPVTTASGKVLVRLKVGPVSTEAKAQSLCRDLSITDTWCVKAS